LPPKNVEGNPPTPLLTETCRYEISGNDDETILDFESVLQAAASSPGIVFGDTKEGMFAIRVPEPMRGDRPGGALLNSVGDKGGDVWGKSAAWVDYSGPTVSGPTTPDPSAIYGIAILVHPTSFRANGLWHARTYGLFAHNPFGIHDFLPNRTPTQSGQQPPPHEGGYALPAGESLHFAYRVIFHRDRWSIDQGEQRLSEYIQKQPALR
jgi:hypothetical protein